MWCNILYLSLAISFQGLWLCSNWLVLVAKKYQITCPLLKMMAVINLKWSSVDSFQFQTDHGHHLVRIICQSISVNEQTGSDDVNRYVLHGWLKKMIGERRRKQRSSMNKIISDEIKFLIGMNECRQCSIFVRQSLYRPNTMIFTSFGSFCQVISSESLSSIDTPPRQSTTLTNWQNKNKKSTNEWWWNQSNSNDVKPFQVYNSALLSLIPSRMA